MAKFVSSPKIEWAKEIKMAQKLLALHKEEDFWISLSLNAKITTLSWFLTSEGKIFLAAAKNFKPVEKTDKELILEEQKIGEDLNLKVKPKTVFDFLNYGKK